MEYNRLVVLDSFVNISAPIKILGSETKNTYSLRKRLLTLVCL